MMLAGAREPMTGGTLCRRKMEYSYVLRGPVRVTAARTTTRKRRTTTTTTTTKRRTTTAKTASTTMTMTTNTNSNTNSNTTGTSTMMPARSTQTRCCSQSGAPARPGRPLSAFGLSLALALVATVTSAYSSSLSSSLSSSSSSAITIAPSSADASPSSPLKPFGYQSGLLGDISDGTFDRIEAERFNDDSYASAMAYDRVRSVLYITGATYGAYFDGPRVPINLLAGANARPEMMGELHLNRSDCFLSAIEVPSLSPRFGIGGGGGNGTVAGGGGGGPRVLRSLRVGVAGIPEACTTLGLFRADGNDEYYYDHDGGDSVGQDQGQGESGGGGGNLDPNHVRPSTVATHRMVLFGRTRDGGLLTGLREKGSTKSYEYGFALNVDLDLRGVLDANANATKDEDGGADRHYAPTETELLGGKLFHTYASQYPAAVAVPPSPPSSSTTSALATTEKADGEDHVADEFRHVAYVAMLKTDEMPIDDDDDGDNDNDNDNNADRDTVRQGRRGRVYDVIVYKLSRRSITDASRGVVQDQIVGEETYPMRETMEVMWEMPFAPKSTSEYDERADVDIAGLVYVPYRGGVAGDNEAGGVGGGGAGMVAGERRDFLLLAGTTSGYGSAFGSEVPSGNGENAGEGGGRMMDGDVDLDGFVTKLRPDTGKEYVNDNIDGDQQEEEAALRSPPHSIRISSQSGKRDVIKSICIPAGNEKDDDDVRYAYVVGSTEGVMDPDSLPAAGGVQAFVLKLNLDRMVTMWRRQFGGAAGVGSVVVGAGCAVGTAGASDDGTSSSSSSIVYLAGTVKDGGSLVHKTLDPTSSRGMDDVFVIGLDADTGDTRWMRQIGTAADDWLAERGGIVAMPGGAILYGNTRGSLMRWRGSSGASSGEKPMAADVFVMSISAEGEVRETSEFATNLDETGSAVGPTLPGPEGQISGRGDGGTAAATAAPSSFGRPLLRWLLIGFAVTLLVAFLIGGAHRAKDRYFRRRHTREEVEKYLEEFDDADVDVDVRESATGGWHGIYSLDTEKCRKKAGYHDEVTVELVSLSSGGSSGSGGVGGSSGSGGVGGGGVGGGGLYSTGGEMGAMSLSSSSVVRDAFFFEDDSTRPSGDRKLTPKIGFGPVHDDDDDDYDDLGADLDDANEGEWAEGYAGLVASYNATWDERNPHSMGGGGGIGRRGGGGSVSGSGNGSGNGNGRIGFDEKDDDPGKLSEIM